jgi:hypothetical protein
MSLPDPILRIEERERDRRAWVGEAAAILREGDRERFFVRALLELPIDGEEGFFRYGSWIEVSPDDFEVLDELWPDEDAWRSRPFSGTLANELHPYAFTEGLPVQLRLREVRVLPRVELVETDHELMRAQRNGISVHRAHQLAETLSRVRPARARTTR